MIETTKAAAVLGVTPGRIRQYVLAGQLDCKKLAGRLFFKASDLRAFKRPPKGRPANG